MVYLQYYADLKHLSKENGYKGDTRSKTDAVNLYTQDLRLKLSLPYFFSSWTVFGR